MDNYWQWCYFLIFGSDFFLHTTRILTYKQTSVLFDLSIQCRLQRFVNWATPKIVLILVFQNRQSGAQAMGLRWPNVIFLQFWSETLMLGWPWKRAVSLIWGEFFYSSNRSRSVWKSHKFYTDLKNVSLLLKRSQQNNETKQFSQRLYVKMMSVGSSFFIKHFGTKASLRFWNRHAICDFFYTDLTYLKKTKFLLILGLKAYFKAMAAPGFW